MILFHNPHFNIATALIHLTTGSQWNHAALMVDDIHVIEATDKGVVKSLLASKTDTLLVIDPRYTDDEDKWNAIAWADAREGVRYGYFNAFMCGVNNVLVGLHLAIKKTDAIICSELVAEALSHAGFDMGKDSSQVSPGDLATYFHQPR